MMEVSRRLFAAALLVHAALVAVGPAAARVFLAKSEALEAAFPGADEVVARDVFLTEEQMAQITHLAGEAPASALVSMYEGRRRGAVLGYALFETHEVRTMPETLLVVITPAGAVERVLMCAFYEPPDYLPPDRWLGTLQGLEDPARAALGRGVAGITGSTLSARAVAGAIRRSLAIHQVCKRASAGGSE